jgi:hypothetical protein
VPCVIPPAGVFLPGCLSHWLPGRESVCPKLPHAEHCTKWRRAIALMLDSGSPEAVYEATQLALLFDRALDLKELDRLKAR